MQTSVGAVKVQPFAVGRVTFWDNSFDEFSPEQDDQTRLWSSAGVRLSTTMQRVYDSVDSSLLDLHRLRHIIEPNATLWYAGTTVESRTFQSMTRGRHLESLVDRVWRALGVKTFQTQRGGQTRGTTSTCSL